MIINLLESLEDIGVIRLITLQITLTKSGIIRNLNSYQLDPVIKTDFSPQKLHQIVFQEIMA